MVIKLFDIIHSTSKKCKKGEFFMVPEPFIEYLIHFHGDRDYFECHEVLEEYWKEQKGSKTSIWVGFIQLAVGQYHYRRNNVKGAKRMLLNSLHIFRQHRAIIRSLGISPDQLEQLVNKLLLRLQKGLPYESINLPIVEPSLEGVCIEECKKRKLIWQTPSDLSNTYLIHRHSLRNRQDVVEARLESLQKKKRKKQ
jgi:uncharacterized protein